MGGVPDGMRGSTAAGTSPTGKLLVQHLPELHEQLESFSIDSESRQDQKILPLICRH